MRSVLVHRQLKALKTNLHKQLNREVILTMLKESDDDHLFCR